MKKLVVAFVVFGFISVLIAACGSGSSSSSGTDVHMGDTNFIQSSVTIHKGSSFNLIDDTGTVHIIENGSWNNDNPQPKLESGAPNINQQFSGSDTHAIGPFNTAGTYHLYCVVHPGMNLMVTVQ